MKLEIKQNLVSPSKYKIKCPHSMKPEYVTFHNTDNKAPAKNEVAYMIRNDNQVSFHVAVDDIEAIQGIPFNRNAWHCGDGGNGTGNRKSIGVEICYNTLGANDAKFKKAEDNAAKVCADLLKHFNLSIDRLKPHKHWSGKNCPSTTNHSLFIEKVKKELKNDDKIYNIITGGFGAKENAQKELEKLYNFTDWYLTLEEFKPNDWRIRTGGFTGEDKVKNKMKALIELTGWWCDYILE